MADNDRIAELEMLIMEHEQSIESLSQTLHRQQLLIQQLQNDIDRLDIRLKSLQNSPVKRLEDETPPPHY